MPFLNRLNSNMSTDTNGGDSSRAESPVFVEGNSSMINNMIKMKYMETKLLLRQLNQAQALQQNIQELRQLGGVTKLAMDYLYVEHSASSSSSSTSSSLASTPTASTTGLDVLAGTSGSGTAPSGVSWFGIDIHTIKTRRELWGHNYLPVAPRKSFWTLFAGTFEDATLQILMVAAFVSLAVGIYEDPATGYIEGCAILMACIIVSVVTACNDYQKESQFRELSAVNDEQVDVVVVRGGTHWQIPVTEIVVGDIVCIEAGDQIPCDGILLHADQLQVDESALTGEPVDVDKELDYDPFVLSGCTVQAGSGKFVAIAVGKDSQWGIIKSKLEKEQEQTPLQEKLDDMAAMIGYVGMGAAGATFIAMMFIKIVIQPDYLREYSIFSYVLEAFIIGVTIVVVAVPEGLPLAVTISLAFSTKKMLADQNLIRHLAACETMGNATNICSDKTGTLTQNQMTVVKGIFADTRCDDTIHRVPVLISPKALHYILEGIACCSTARIVRPPPPPPLPTTVAAGIAAAAGTEQLPSPERLQVIGNKTEGALLLLARSDWSHQDNTDKRRARANFDKPHGSRLFSFSSSRKRMSVLVHYPGDTNNNNNGTNNKSPIKGVSRTGEEQIIVPFETPTWTLYHKGAAEIILKDCTHYLGIDGREMVMTSTKRIEFERVIQSFAKDALRCVAMAHKSNIQHLVNPHTCSAMECEMKLEKNMCLDAIAGIMDPLRPDVIEAVAICQRAGIFVRMVTGDNLDTATEIARQCGILTKHGITMLGEDFRKLTPKQLDDILPRLQVLARSSPEDKHLLVQRLNGALIPSTEAEWLELHPGRNFLKEKDLLLPGYKEEWAVSRNGVGEVVGVTGDGTNDAPALKAADVGLSMGKCGTDVAKKASDIIIMDDNFSSIVKAVLWGRSVFDNIRKFLQFQLTVNVVALTITFLSAVAGYKPPLNAVMMLWVNLIMDTMGALALGTEPPRQELLDRRPYRRDATLISRPMWRNILCQATYQLIVLVFLLNQGPNMFGCEDGSNHHFTIIFNAFVFAQVFNEFNAREIGDQFNPLRSISQSPMFLLVIFFTVISQWFIIEYGGDFTQTHPLNYIEWKITVGLGAGSLPVGFLMRLIPVYEDVSTFAGIETYNDPQLISSTKTSHSRHRHKKDIVEYNNKRQQQQQKNKTFVTILLTILIPVLGAIVYQLYYEIIEFVRIK